MNNSRLPLPLELTQPVLLAGDLNTQLRDALTAGGYDTRTQLCSSTHSNVKSATLNAFGIQVDVNADVNVDDILA
jgi:endonuclease/exonuclease/phosphatase (EEP) superfamily protein YafD